MNAMTNQRRSDEFRKQALTEFPRQKQQSAEVRTM